jgi:peptide/nickel transport system ATP-binding protein
VSLGIGEGEILAVVGESGSGKSVLALSMLGLLSRDPAPETRGRVETCGVDMLGASDDATRLLRQERLGAVFQDPMTSLNPTMQVGRQVVEAAGDQTAAVRLLERVGIPEPARRLKAFPHELSGGQRQRVMLAMAVAGSPELVVADEPTTALDVTVQAQILSLLAELRDEVGCSLLLITHDLGVAAQVADRIAVLYGGRVAEIGSTAQILSAPAHPYTRGLIASRLRLGADSSRSIRSLPGEPPSPVDPPPGCPFAPRCRFRIDACDEQPPDPLPATSHSGVVACIRESEIAHQDLELGEPWSTPPLNGHNGSRLSVEQVTKNFAVRESAFRRRELHALKGVDLEVAMGEAVALVGESGSGKSTLLRILAGLDEADTGRVRLPEGHRAQMLFQDAGASLTPWLTVREHLVERLRGERSTRQALDERVAEALRLVGLPPEVADAKPTNLSGGQRQRVAFARATIVPPAVLLCDEPTSALDASLAAQVLNLLGRLRREMRMAVLFVTHDLAIAGAVADRIAVMYLGEIVEVGPSRQVLAEPQHPYTRALLAAVPDMGVVPPVTD